MEEKWRLPGHYGEILNFKKKIIKTFKNLAQEGPNAISFPAHGIKLSNKTKRRYTSQG